MNLNFRHEFKYTLEVSEALALEQEIRRLGLGIDAHTPAGSSYYYVNSLYFDSPSLDFYHEKVGGMIQRKKMRLRTYAASMEDGGRYWLEMKYKFETQTAKSRAVLDADSATKLLAGNTNIVANIEQEDIRQALYERPLRPWLLVRYKRRAYTDAFDSMRVTFDYDLETTETGSLSHASALLPVNPQQVLVEVKFRHLMPAWFSQILRSFVLERTVHSKYTLCADRARLFYPLYR